MTDRFAAHLSRDRGDGTAAQAGYLTSVADDVISATEEFVAALMLAAVPEAAAFQAALRQAQTIRMKGPVTWPA